MKTTSECEGHPASEFDSVVKTVFCDGSCSRPDCDMHQPLLQSAEDHRREDQNGADESNSFADSYYSLRDEGRNPDGSGQSYAERNA